MLNLTLFVDIIFFSGFKVCENFKINKQTVCNNGLDFLKKRINAHYIQDNIFKKVDPRPSFLMHTQRSRIQKLGLF